MGSLPTSGKFHNIFLLFPTDRALCAGKSSPGCQTACPAAKPPSWECWPPSQRGRLKISQLHYYCNKVCFQVNSRPSWPRTSPCTPPLPHRRAHVHSSFFLPPEGDQPPCFTALLKLNTGTKFLPRPPACDLWPQASRRLVLPAPPAPLGSEAAPPPWLCRRLRLRALPRSPHPPHTGLAARLAWLPLNSLPPPRTPPRPPPPGLASRRRVVPSTPPHMGAAPAGRHPLGDLPRPADGATLSPLLGLPLHLPLGLVGCCSRRRSLLAHALAAAGPQGSEPWCHGGALPAGEQQDVFLLFYKTIFFQAVSGGRLNTWSSSQEL